MIRYLELISVPNQSKDSITLIEFDTLSFLGRMLVSIGVSGAIHIIGHIFMMQKESFRFGF